MLNANEKFNINKDVEHKLKYKNPNDLILWVIGSLMYAALVVTNGVNNTIKLPDNNKTQLNLVVE